MKNFYTVFKFHLKEGFTSKPFILTGIFLFILILSFFAYSHYSDEEEKLTIAVLNLSEDYALDAKQINKTYDFIESNQIHEKDIAKQKLLVKNGDLDGILILSEIDKKPNVQYVYKTYPSQQLAAVIQNDIQMQKFYKVAAENNIDEKTQLALTEPIVIDQQPIEEDKVTGLVYFFSYAIFVFILMYGQMVSMGIAGEKATRVMEIMITKVRPITMMYAKVISSLCMGLFTIFIGALSYISAILLNWTDNEQINIFGMPIDLTVLTIEMLMYFIVYFTLGYILYAILLASFSAAVSRIEDVSSAIFPISLLLMGAFFLCFKAMTEPNNVLVVIGSYFPFFSPLVSFSRIIMEESSAGEILGSIVILIATIVLLSYFANRIYLNGVMKYTNKTSFKDIMNMAKK